MTLSYEALLYIVLLAIVPVFWAQTGDLIYPAGVFPRMVLIIIALSATVALIRCMLSGSGEKAVDRRFLFVLLVTGSVVLYTLAITRIGYYPATLAYLLLLYPTVNLVKDGKRPTGRLAAVSAVAAIGVTAALYVVFTVMLKINVPRLFENGVL